MAAGIRVERERKMEGRKGERGERGAREREKGKEGGSISWLAILSASLVSLNMNVMLD